MENKIRMEVDSLEVMNTKQPETISINGVEIPSYSCLWHMVQKADIRISRLRNAVILEAIALIAVSLRLLLMR